MQNTNFIHVHTAALRGLPKAVSGDQALVHALELLTARKSDADGYSYQQMATKLYCVKRHAEAGDVQEAEAEAAQVHGSGPLPLAVETTWLLLPLAGGKYPVSDSVGKLVRPLLYRLVGDANCLGGCGDGPAQQFDGLCFLHALLNHSSEHFATIVKQKKR